jgi:hypothetical protein
MLWVVFMALLFASLAHGQTTLAVTANTTYSALLASNSTTTLAAYTVSVNNNAVLTLDSSLSSFTFGNLVNASGVTGGSVSVGSQSCSITAGSIACYGNNLSAGLVQLSGSGPYTVNVGNLYGGGGGALRCTSTGSSAIYVTAGSVSVIGGTVITVPATDSDLINVSGGTFSIGNAALTYAASAAGYYPVYNTSGIIQCNNCVLTAGTEGVNASAVYSTTTGKCTCTNCSFVNSSVAYAVGSGAPTVISTLANNYTQYATPTGTVNYPAAATIVGPWPVTNNTQGTATQVGPWPITKNPDGSYNIGPWPIK